MLRRLSLGYLQSEDGLDRLERALDSLNSPYYLPRMSLVGNSLMQLKTMQPFIQSYQ